MSQPVPGPAGSTPRSGGGCARWAFGCGALLLIVLVVAGAATWWFVGRPVTEVFQSLQRLEAQGTLEQRLANRAAYQPPADGLLSEAQVVRYLEAQRQMQRELAERAERLTRRLDEVDRTEPQLADVIRMAEAYREVLRLVVEAVDVQTTALDTHGFSAEEYRWVRWEVLRAAGVPGAAYGVDGLAAGFTGQEGRVEGPPPQAPVPEANRDLVAPYREEIEETIGLALLGL